MAANMRENGQISAHALVSLIEEYLHTPSPEVETTLRSLLGQWKSGSKPPLPRNVLENALEQSPVAVSITDIEANILYANRCFAEVTGYRSDEILGKNESVLSYKSTPDEVYRELWQTLGNKQRWSGTLVNKRKDGSRYLAEVLITPVLDEAGEVTHYLGIHRDITDLFALERKVSNQKALIESVVDTTPAAIAVLDENKTIILDNQAYKKLVGDMRGEEPAHLLLDKLAEEYEGFAQMVSSQITFHDHEIACRIGGKGELRWFSCSGIWFREQAASVDAFFNERKVPYMLLVAHEITSQKQQQEVIRRNAMRALLAEEGMVQGNHETLTAAIFQLESPFNMLGAALDMLERRAGSSPLDESLLNVLSTVREQGMQAIMNLRGAVPSSGIAEPAPVNLNQLVHDVLLVSTERLLSEGIQVDWQPSSRLPSVNGWETRLRSMIKQLLDNAIEAIVDSDPAMREIRLTTDAEEGWVRMSVCDTGNGIPEALRIKVFEPFYSTRDPARERHSGMGLTLAQEVVNQHAGTIEIVPALAQGCCIQVRLPAVKQ